MSTKQVERERVYPVPKPGLYVQPSSTTQAQKAAKARRAQKLQTQVKSVLGWSSPAK